MFGDYHKKKELRDEFRLQATSALLYCCNVNVREGLGVKARWVEVVASVLTVPTTCTERLPKFAFHLISRVMKHLLNGLAREAVGPKVMW